MGRIFAAFSHSSKIDPATGNVSTQYRTWVEEQLQRLESAGHDVFCALRHDDYKVNTAKPAEAFFLDTEKIEWCDTLVAFLSESASTGVQTEIGYAIAKAKQIVLVRHEKTPVAWFNLAMEESGVVKIVDADFDPASLELSR